MSFPFEYDHGAPLGFGGALPETRSFDGAQIVILPVPVDRTTSYVGGTRNGPREILASRKPLRFDLSGRVMAVDGRPFPEARCEERER